MKAAAPVDTFKLRILHISDLHERGSREPSPWRRQLVLGSEWERNLDALLADGPIHLVCFTGDVANSGKAGEYGPVTVFLKALLGRLSLPLERLFVVPGNHDIDRKRGVAAWKFFRANWSHVRATELSDWLADGKKPPPGFKQGQRKQLLSRQAAYRGWLGTELGRSALLPESSPHKVLGYRSTLRLDAFPFDLHIIGLDSAWACGDDHDAGELLLTDGQVGKLTTDEMGRKLSGFRLALVHHPLTELADVDDCRRLIASNTDLLLRGHRHSEEVETWNDPDHTARQLAAGCLYEGHAGNQWKNGCHVIEATLDKEGRPQRYDLRFRAWSSRGFWHDADSLYRDSPNGRLRWQLVRETVEAPLPPRQPVFVGREEELRRLGQAILPESRKPVALCALNGMPGVGKTYLAERFFSQHQERFPGGLAPLALDPGIPASAETLLGQLADRFKLPAGAGLATRVRERLLAPLTLLLLENVDSEAATVVANQLAQQLPGCPLIVTGRFSGWTKGADWEVIDVQPLEQKTALEQLAREWRPPEAGELPERVRLVEALGGLPLALHLAAGYLRFGHTVESFLTKLRATRLTLKPVVPTDHLLRSGQDEARAVLSSTFELSLGLLRQQLGAEAERLLSGFAALGEAPHSGFGRSLGAALTGLAQTEFPDLLQHTLLLSLVTRVPELERKEDAWRIHPLLAELLRTRPGAEQGLPRMTEWFVERLPELPPEQGEQQGTRWKEVQQENAALVSWLQRVPEAELSRVEQAGSQYAKFNGPLAAWMGFCERALAVPCTPEERSHLLWTLTQVAQRCGASDRALSAALEMEELDRQRGDERGGALAAGARADVLQARGQFDEALRIRQEEQLPVYEKLGDVREHAVTLGQIADVLQARGQFDEALRIRQEEELPVYEKLGDVRSRAVTLGQIAEVLQARGQLDEALRILQEEELPVYEKLGEVRSRAVTLGNIADVLQDRGQFDEALRIRQEEELPVYEKLGDVCSRAVTLGQIAEVLQARGQLDEALRIRQEEELPVYEKLGHIHYLLVGRINLAVGSRIVSRSTGGG